jgi:hypothetical protein
MKKILLAILLLAGACTKDLKRDHQPAAVIESYLVPGQPVFVKITWELPWGANIDTLVPLEDLSPVLVQNQTVHSLAYLGNGYYGNPNIRLQEKDSCYLYFEHNGRQVSAYTVIPGKPTGVRCNPDTVLYLNTGIPNSEFDPGAIEFRWDNPGNDYHMMVIRYPRAKPWWQPPLNPNSVQSYVYYGKPTKETVSWFLCSDYLATGNYTMDLYRIQPEYAIMFNENHSSLLDITEPPHNITNGYGIFTGMSLADSVKIYSRYR